MPALIEWTPVLLKEKVKRQRLTTCRVIAAVPRLQPKHIVFPRAAEREALHNDHT